MAQVYPSLALSDIVHIMSPSPVPQASLDDSHLLRQKSSTPEPLQESEVQKMRTRIVDMGFSGIDQVNASSREKELLDMITRLTNAVRLDPEQLMRQASTISRLTEQRSYLVYQAEEQRLRWESERDGWTRMAEALIGQQNKNAGSIYREEDTERQKAGFEADNKALRQKACRKSNVEQRCYDVLTIMQIFSLMKHNHGLLLWRLNLAVSVHCC
ncbi:hypothetical protein SERLA73DRAFT_113661 [Serpula lacrymans var. lacrymans S7.3]|uniref:Uncharacterized protein n=1 Tax=Serpula lacrymans var. lacrymans (strain S7.3) TaxID=936435 RepID=F8Q8P3_SERL3|nr:hypothetical protein SERLA73DRAFT_113661 [Serpula lacrymans var. lacrymans S7.3]